MVMIDNPSTPADTGRAHPLRVGVVVPTGGLHIRVVATGMLVVMAMLFVTAKFYQDVHPAVGFVRAFAEAAMVGGLADWFAVTALFRHPMGIPIPHTAIVPRNKNRIGDTLARFLLTNFLLPRLVARKMQTLDVAGDAGLSAKLTRATIDTKENIITSNEPVTVTMAAGTISANQMTARQKVKEYTFVENVRTHLNARQPQPGDEAAAVVAVSPANDQMIGTSTGPVQIA